MENYLRILIIISPVIFAGTVHSVAIKKDFLSNLKKPLDFSRKIDGWDIFGENKTFRGVTIMFFFSIIGASIVYLLGWRLISLGDSVFYANPLSSMMLGASMALAYSAGELPNSFLKRRLHIPPGHRKSGVTKPLFYFLDQSDSVIAVTAMLMIFYGLEIEYAIQMIAVAVIIHIIFDVILYKSRVKVAKTI